MKIIDTHQHLWDLDLFRYSWLHDNPALNRSYRSSDYLAATHGFEVVKSVHIEADVDEQFLQKETEYILKVADQPDNPMCGVVACGRPESRDFQSKLDKILGWPKLKGIRRVLHTQPDDLGENKLFVENVSSLSSYGLSFDICTLARNLPVAIRLVSKCPDVTFILDHCGVPRVRERVLDPWRLHIEELSKSTNVFCKISGLVAYANLENWTDDDLRPYIEHVIACFGWDRVLFGSDWPVCTLASSFARWVNALEAITESTGEENQEKLFHDNALRVYRLD